MLEAGMKAPDFTLEDKTAIWYRSTTLQAKK